MIVLAKGNLKMKDDGRILPIIGLDQCEEDSTLCYLVIENGEIRFKLLSEAEILEFNGQKFSQEKNILTEIEEAESLIARAENTLGESTAYYGIYKSFTDFMDKYSIARMVI